MKIKTLLLITILFLVKGQSYAQTESLSGLHFSSHEVIKDKRTSLDLTPEEPFVFTDGFILEFDAKFRPGDGYYGYVFRAIGNNNVNIDLISNLGSTSTNFSLVLKNNVLFSYKWDDVPNGDFGTWIKVKVQIDTKDSRISISLNGNSKEKKVEGIEDLKNFDLVFGAYRHNPFLTTDVATMTLKNVAIYNPNYEIFRNWKLSKHGENKVYDEIASAAATVYNPIWEIDKHLEWKTVKTLQLDGLIGVAKDEDQGRVFLVDHRAVYIYNIETSQIDTVFFSGGQPFHCQGNQMIFNPFTDELWSYDFNRDTISIFNFETRSWSLSETTCQEPDLWHHNKFISPLDTALITFGGYGFYNYKSLLNKFSPKTGKWENVDLREQIHPRYMSALGLTTNQKTLIFGGYGSLTGRQELSPKFYYDLYALDSKDFSVEKLWTLETEAAPFVPCEALLVDTTSDSFFTLIYNPSNFETSLRLAKFNINEPEVTLYADSVPYKFLDTKSWSTLFLNKKTSELIALTIYDSEFSLYSLAYPPLLPQDIYQNDFKGNSPYSALKVWVGGALLLLIIIVLFIFFRKKGKRIEAGAKLVNEADGYVDTPKEEVQKATTSAIFFLGGFQVFDKNGNDITSNFTPTLKQLFLLIYLSSLKNGKGISSIKLKETLWFDKTEASARNNQNVNISKLRTLLDRIGNVKLDNDNTYWKITVGVEVYCDHIEALELIDKAKSTLGLQEEEVLRIIHIASLGELCPDAQTEWMDEFKADFANKVIDALTLLSNNLPDSIDNKPRLLCDISDCILKYDVLNEGAIAIKCAALYQLGKKGIAKHSYDLFCREYKNLLGVEYPLSFNALLKS